ncbi:PIN domain-containing protein [Nocardiopsis sp. EMB25]|uniref:PIN domain-containing protein n=1 Tax=Nocardiopsis TaxID=2013 RepID=UPI000348F619|nr:MULTISPECIES: PIN domain-containing protein [Nocardiopsis]MCY9785587.1 PIN domain-containing protein [Nocardiopsis sp. EMB25]
MKQVVLDSGFLIALERRDPRAYQVQELLYEASAVAHVSAGVLAQVWRGDPRQQVIAKLLKFKGVLAHPLDPGSARRVGALLARSGTSDVVDGHVALLAAELNATVLTSDPDDIGKLDPTLRIVRV